MSKVPFGYEIIEEIGKVRMVHLTYGRYGPHTESMDKKRCYTCGLEKPHEAFSRASNAGDGLCSSCRVCVKLNNRERRRLRSDMSKSRHKPRDSKAQSRAWALREKMYGLCRGALEGLFRVQGEVCAICRHKVYLDASPKAVVDHCHKTGNVRGILCSRCNSTLGYLNDDPVRARRAAEYLEAHSR